MGATSTKSSTYATRIGAHHFAHLRAVAEGVPVPEAARRYLGIDHGHQAEGAHRWVVEQLRAVARRQGDRAWRLIGLTIRDADAAQRPPLSLFIEERELEDWSESEALALYEEAHPRDPKLARREKLRLRQLALLRTLQAVAATDPRPQDPISAWFEPGVARRLEGSGLLLLADLAALMAAGGHWWRAIPAIGAVKAARIQNYLLSLLPNALAGQRRVFPAPRASPSQDTAPRTALRPALPSPDTPPRLGTAALTSAQDDSQAIAVWVAARAGSRATAISYSREALRLLLWLTHERNAGFRTMQTEDCLAYLTFLEHIPADWISRQRCAVLAPGWAPFRGPLTLSSRRQAVVILRSFFTWLVDTGYLPLRNPWLLINRRSGDDAGRHELDSRAFTPEAWDALLRQLATQPPSPAKDRIEFLLSFIESTGLRASELVDARLGAFRMHKSRLALQVQGKGSRNRVIAVPGQARQALDRYLSTRGINHVLDAPPDAPLIASTKDPLAPIGYQTLYSTMKRWIQRCVDSSSLPESEKRIARLASPHWLRHTFGTRALERKAPLEVIQRQLGHADPRTTMRYAKAQLERMQTEMDAVFG